jgi:hypothetical protein
MERLVAVEARRQGKGASMTVFAPATFEGIGLIGIRTARANMSAKRDQPVQSNRKPRYARSKHRFRCNRPICRIGFD